MGGAAGRVGVMGGVGEPLADVARRWVEDSCARQGVPVKVEDPLVMDDVAELLSAGRDPAISARPA